MYTVRTLVTFTCVMIDAVIYVDTQVTGDRGLMGIKPFTGVAGVKPFARVDMHTALGHSVGHMQEMIVMQKASLSSARNYRSA